MAIGKKKKSEVDKQWEALDPPEKKYSDVELADFHKKIQRFREKKTLTSGEEVLVLNWDKMAVAFGAYTVTEYQGNPLYRVAGGPDGDTKRFEQLNNLWKQYQDWVRRVDWRENKELEAWDKMAPQELSTGK